MSDPDERWRTEDQELVDAVDEERTPAEGFDRYKWPLALVLFLLAMNIGLFVAGVLYIT